MDSKKPKPNNPIGLVIIALFIAFSVNPVLGFILLAAFIIIFKKNPKLLTTYLAQYADQQAQMRLTDAGDSQQNAAPLVSASAPVLVPMAKTRLQKRTKYLHIALNSTLEEAGEIISHLPSSDRILIEAGTPLIKIYGTEAISRIKSLAPAGTYVVADNKCTDLAAREVEMMASAGANASTCLGVAPIETIDRFIEECQKFGIDSMIDMMNVESALSVLQKLKKLPNVVMLHRGVDESEFSKEKQIPYYQIKQIKGTYDVLVAVAGGDTIREVQRALFNDADIVVVWKNFYQSNADTASLAESFLNEVK